MVQRIVSANNDLSITNQGSVGLAWLMLVHPLQSWRRLHRGRLRARLCLAPLFAQWLLIGTAQLVALKAVYELALHAGLTSTPRLAGFPAVAWQLLLLTVGVVLANGLTAMALWGLAYLAGIYIKYLQALSLVAYSLLPVALGQALGLVILAIIQPLTHQPEHAVALLIRPFTLSLANLTPISSQPLSLGWVFASYLDVFAVWSLMLVIAGAVHYLRASRIQAVWLGVGLVVLLGLVLTGWWQLLQLVALH